MLYYNESSDNTLYVNTKADAGMTVDIKVRQESNESYEIETTSSLIDGGYYQSITIPVNTIEDSLTDNTTYDFFIYSGGILVYSDKLGYKLTGSTPEFVTPTSTNSDFIII